MYVCTFLFVQSNTCMCMYVLYTTFEMRQLCSFLQIEGNNRIFRCVKTCCVCLQELEGGVVKLMMATPNSRNKCGFNTDRFVLDPSCTSSKELKHLR